MARHVNDLLRASDVRCPYGRDEFMVILPETPAAGAHQVAEHIRRAVASLRMPVGSDMLTVTTSIGVTTSHPRELDAETMIARADGALYGAKRGGRNAVNIDRQNLSEVAWSLVRPETED